MNLPRLAFLMQGQQVLKDGVGRGSEVEETIDPKEARTFLMDPGALFALKSDILQPVLRWAWQCSDLHLCLPKICFSHLCNS